MNITHETFEQSLKLLRDLADLQNDAPLEKYRKQWKETMDKVYEFLGKWEDTTGNTMNITHEALTK